MAGSYQFLSQMKIKRGVRDVPRKKVNISSHRIQSEAESEDNDISGKMIEQSNCEAEEQTLRKTKEQQAECKERVIGNEKEGKNNNVTKGEEKVLQALVTQAEARTGPDQMEKVQAT